MVNVKTWRSRIKKAEAAREHQLKNWKDLRACVAGDLLKDNPLAETPTNLHNSNVRITVPRLVPRDRKLEVIVTPKRPDSPERNWSEAARMLGDRVNAIITETRMVKQVRKAAAAAMYSVGILKVVHTAKTGIRKAVPAEKDPSQSETVDVDQAQAQGEEFVDPGMPTAMFSPAGRFLVAPGSTSLSDAPWIAFEVFRSVSAVRADPKFAKFAERLKSTHKAAPDPITKDDEGDADEADPLNGMVQLYEIHDRASKKVLTIGGEKCGVEEPLDAQEWPAGVEGYPVAIIDFFSVEGVFWPEPGLLAYSPAMKGGARLDAHIAKMAGNSKTVIAYDPDAIDPKSLQNLADANDGDFVPIRGWNKVASQVTLGTVTEQHISVADRLKMRADEMSGVDELRRGGPDSGAKATATEVDARVRLGEIRIDDARSAVDEAVRECAEIMAAMLLANQDAFSDLILPGRKTGQSVAFSAQLPSEVVAYAFEMKATSVDRVDPAIRLKRLQDSIGVLREPQLVQQLAAEGVQVRIAPLVVELLRAMDVEDPEQYVVETPPQTDQQTALATQEDQAMLQPGAQPIPTNPDDDHAAHLEVHAADYQQSQSEVIGAHIMAHETAMQQPGSAPQTAPAPQTGGAGTGVEQAAGLRAEARGG